MAGSKLPKSETDSRVQQCYDMRYNSNDGLLFRNWVKYCHENYGDKSEQQYTAYWVSSSEIYQESWREKLSKQLDPAVNELIGLLASDDEKIRSRAVDQIMKYTGNDVEKIEAKIQGNIELNWGGVINTDPGDEQE